MTNRDSKFGFGVLERPALLYPQPIIAVVKIIPTTFGELGCSAPWHALPRPGRLPFPAQI